MLFDDAFLNTIADDPVLAVLGATTQYFELLGQSQDQENYQDYEYEAALETYALVTSIAEAYAIEIDALDPDLTGNMQVSSRNLSAYFREVATQFEGHFSTKKINSFKRKFQSSIGVNFSYEFSQGDLEKIQALLNDLRVQISNSPFFEDSHKHRLLKRLERLQAELHKRVSDLDRFWGLLGDAGVALGKFGKDAKPIVDRIKEIADIVWRTQSRAEELPSNAPSPLLGNEASPD